MARSQIPIDLPHLNDYYFYNSARLSQSYLPRMRADGLAGCDLGATDPAERSQAVPK